LAPVAMLALAGAGEGCASLDGLARDAGDAADAKADAIVDGTTGADGGSDADASPTDATTAVADAPSDAPSEAASCAADTRVDPANCGACGHDCLGALCKAGVCQVGTFVAQTASVLHADDKNLYWINNVFWRAPLRDGSMAVQMQPDESASIPPQD